MTLGNAARGQGLKRRTAKTATPTSCSYSSKTSSISEPGLTGPNQTALSSAGTARSWTSISVEGRRTWFETLDEMRTVLDQYLVEYNTKRPHQGPAPAVRLLPPPSLQKITSPPP
jgi:Integrase core domain